MSHLKLTHFAVSIFEPRSLEITVLLSITDLVLTTILLVVIAANSSMYFSRSQLLMILSLLILCEMISRVAFYSKMLTHIGMYVMMFVMLYFGFEIGLSYSYLFIKNYYNKEIADETC